jgi:hypothetical protein
MNPGAIERIASIGAAEPATQPSRQPNALATMLLISQPVHQIQGLRDAAPLGP